MKNRCKECRLHLWPCPHCHSEYCYNVFCELNTFSLHQATCRWFFQKSKNDEPLYHARAGRMMGNGESKVYRGPKFGENGQKRFF